MELKNWEIKLGILHKRVEAFYQGYRQNVALLGDNADEITYLLESYFSSVPSKNIVRIRTTTSYLGKNEFFRAIAFSILSEYSCTASNLDILLGINSPTIPATTNFIKICLGKNDITFLDCLEVINKFINETGKKCILIINEFSNLPELFNDFNSDFSKFIILQNGCMVLLTASHMKSAEKFLSGELNLLFGNFEKVFLNEISFLKNALYLKEKISPCSPSPCFMSFFINAFGTNLMYYDIISPFIRKHYSAENEDASALSIIAETLYSKETYFYQYFIQKIKNLEFIFKDHSTVVKLLLAISQGYLRKKDLIALNIYGPKDLILRLQKLLDANYIENLGDIYKIQDSLFSFWLCHIFRFYFSTPALSPVENKRFFSESLKEEMLGFREDFYTDKIKKVMQLFSLFRNDTLRLGKNKYRLPSMEKVKLVSYPQKEFHLLVGEGKEIVFTGVKETDTSENDLVEFIEKGRNVKGRSVRKIFISLGEIPSTVKLIAKNNKIIAWDIDDINRLFSVYNRAILGYETTPEQRFCINENVMV
ncbi:MAG: hypothetical protein PHU64_04755 [Candidatus Omnitrophica bacterium]|nr:hypothetical protein [Candidatus Omnitrophota bacterium]MDD5429720.1 hypothetical protein [Candidatus Omnitrophota bacterium]